MRDYTLSEIELIGEYTSKYRRDTQDLNVLTIYGTRCRLLSWKENFTILK